MPRKKQMIKDTISCSYCGNVHNEDLCPKCDWNEQDNAMLERDTPQEEDINTVMNSQGGNRIYTNY